MGARLRAPPLPTHRGKLMVIQNRLKEVRIACYKFDEVEVAIVVDSIWNARHINVEKSRRLQFTGPWKEKVSRFKEINIGKK